MHVVIIDAHIAAEKRHLADGLPRQTAGATCPEAFEPLQGRRPLVQAPPVAMGAGVAGGLYPAWRATRMRPVEALRYE
jgi:hypothetical protein